MEKIGLSKYFLKNFYYYNDIYVKSIDKHFANVLLFGIARYCRKCAYTTIQFKEIDKKIFENTSKNRIENKGKVGSIS